MTQEQLADKLGVTRQTVSKWKNNMSVPDADILSEMADVFDVSVSELLGYGADNGSTKDYAKILASLNGELAEKSRFRKSILRIIKAVLILLGVGFAALILYILLSTLFDEAASISSIPVEASSKAKVIEYPASFTSLLITKESSLLEL